MEHGIDRECPICGQDNNCRHDAECWCHKETFPKHVFNLIPEEKKGKACICKACLEKYRQQS